MSVGAFQNSVLRTGQPARRRPRWPYAINTDNWQSDGLILCPGFNIAAGNNQTLYDLTEGKRHGTLGGSPIWTHDPQVGECLYFGGSQARRVTWGAVFPTLTAATIFLLVRCFGNNNGSPVGFTSDDFFCTHYPFSGSDDGNSVYLSTLNSTRNFLDDSSFSKKQWHILAITSVNGSVTNGWKVFQNGRRVTQATSPSSITFHSTRRSLGQASDGSSGCQTWSGFIADFRLYNRAMSEAEVAAITLETFTDVYYEIGRRTVFLPAQIVALAGDAKGKATANQTPLGLLEAGRTAGKATTGQTPFGLLTNASVLARANANQTPFGLRLGSASIDGRTLVLLDFLDALGFGYSTGRSTATGFLTTAVGLNGLSTGRNRARGDLLLSLAFAGSTFGRGRIPSAALSLSYALSGIVRANSSARANVLSVQVPLAGSVMGSGRVLPALDEWRVYAGPRHVRSFTVRIRDSRTFKV